MQVLQARVEVTLSVALRWFTQNRLKINPAKTEMVILKSRRQNFDPNFSIRFGSDEIKPMNSVKVLGVVIDSHLSWDAHITSVVRKCYCVLVSLARIRHKLPRCTKKLLVEALVFPHIRYCLSVWGSCTKSQKRRVQKAINFGVRIVSGLGRRDHVTPTLQSLGWRTVDELLTERDLINVQHILIAVNGPELLREQLMLRSDVSSRYTRAVAAGRLQLPRVRTEFARRNFHFRAATTWND